MRLAPLVFCFLLAAPAFAQDAPTADVPVDPPAPWLAPPGNYELDPAATEVTLTARRFLMSPIHADFATVDGTLTVTIDAPDASALTVGIAAGELSANGPVVESMLKGADFLNVEVFPTIDFNVEGFTVSDAPSALSGELSMAGVSHAASFATQLESHSIDPETGALRLHFVSEGELDRRDWGMSGYRGIVSDTVRIRIEADFVRTDELPAD